MVTCKSCYAPCPDDAVFCQRCGSKIEKRPEPKIPRTMTVKEAAEIFFRGRVSAGLIYASIREGKLPHVKLSGGKILLDADELSAWWDAEIQKSKTPVTTGLRRII